MTGLYIFLGIILFILAVLMIPVHVAADYKEEFSLKIKFLFFFKYVIFPMKEKKKEKEEKQKEKPKNATRCVRFLHTRSAQRRCYAPRVRLCRPF